MSCDNLATKEDVQRISSDIRNLRKQVQDLTALLKPVPSKLDAVNSNVTSTRQAVVPILPAVNALRPLIARIVAWIAQYGPVLTTISAIVGTLLDLFRTFFRPNKDNQILSELRNIANQVQAIRLFVNSIFSAIRRIEGTLNRQGNVLNNISSNVRSLLGKADNIISQNNTTRRTLEGINNNLSQVKSILEQIRSTANRIKDDTSSISSNVSVIKNTQLPQLASLGRQILSKVNPLLSAINEYRIPINQILAIVRNLRNFDGSQILNSIADLRTLVNSVNTKVISIDSYLRGGITGLLNTIIQLIRGIDSSNYDSILNQIKKIVERNQTLIQLVNKGVTTNFNLLNSIRSLLNSVNIKLTSLDSYVRGPLTVLVDLIRQLIEGFNEPGTLDCVEITYEDGVKTETTTQLAYASINEKIDAVYEGVLCAINQNVSGSLECQTVQLTTTTTEGVTTTQFTPTITELTYGSNQELILRTLEVLLCKFGYQGTFNCIDEETTEQGSLAYTDLREFIVGFKEYLDCRLDNIEYRLGNECLAGYQEYKQVFPYQYHISIDWYDVNKPTSRYPNLILTGIDVNFNFSNFVSTIKEVWITKGNVHCMLPLVNFSTPAASGNFSSRECADFLFGIYRNYIVEDVTDENRFSEEGFKREIMSRKLRVSRVLFIETTTGNVLQCFKQRPYNLEYIQEFINPNFGVGEYGPQQAESNQV